MRQKLFFATFISILIFGSCRKYPDINEQLEEQDITATEYNKDADFSSYTTFSVVDSIAYIKDSSGAEAPDTTRLDSEAEKDIQNAFIANMEARGYTYVEGDQNPDFILNAAVFYFKNVTIYQNIGWWPGYGWGGYYPYYPTYYYDYSVTKSGSVFMQMEALKDSTEEGVPVHWRGVIDGLLADKNQYDSERVVTRINESFTQSPYFTK